MYLYYVVATEKRKNQEVVDTHAILAKNDLHFVEKCDKLFIKYESYISKYKLSDSWEWHG